MGADRLADYQGSIDPSAPGSGLFYSASEWVPSDKPKWSLIGPRPGLHQAEQRSRHSTIAPEAERAALASAAL
jgi:hypothetical protein